MNRLALGDIPFGDTADHLIRLTHRDILRVEDPPGEIFQSDFFPGLDVHIGNQRLSKFFEYTLVADVVSGLGLHHVAHALDVTDELAKTFGLERETVVGTFPGSVECHVFLEYTSAFQISNRPRQRAIEMIR